MPIRTVLPVLLLVLATGAPAMDGPGAPAPGVGDEVYQLRIYEIFEANKEAFHQRLRDHALRIMTRHGFRVVATWETRHAGRTEFAYLLVWPDATTMRSRWAAFLADEEWKEIKRKTALAHGDLVGGIEDRLLELTPYSPARSLAK